MDALICRVALLLALPVSAVWAMQATDVLALAVSDVERARQVQGATDLGMIYQAHLVNLAVLAPDRLEREQRAVRERYGLRDAAPTVDIATFAAMLDGLLPEGSDGAES